MHDALQQIRNRAERALRERVLPRIEAGRTSLRVEAWPADLRHVDVAEALAADFESFGVGEMWGAPWTTTWFRIKGQIPEAWDGREVEAVVNLGFDDHHPGFQAEGLAYSLDGSIIKGVAPRTSHVPIARVAVGGTEVGFIVEAAANPRIIRRLTPGMWEFTPTELGDIETAGDDPLYRFARADLVWRDPDFRALSADVEALLQVSDELDLRDPRRHAILYALQDALDVLDASKHGPVEAKAALAEVLARPARPTVHRVSAIGHSHIDSAWLWPTGETARKLSRTFANVLQLQDEYPDLVFACSSAQHYAWIKEHKPELFERIRDAVAAGRWVPVGGMWVESDANLVGAEALVRQFLYGKRFFIEELGFEPEDVWLPDSFGCSAALPQIAQLTGARWLFTQKLSWNETNRFPHNTFLWEGIDGTRILTHFPPVDTYSSDLSATDLQHASDTFAEKGVASRSLVPFGYGDGGGGPTREMLERAKRWRDLEGVSPVTLESPREFFQATEAEYQDPPVWNGELYLENHRGTFTSQARTKAGNRRSEHLFREAELWATAAAVQAGAAYPGDELNSLWRQALLLQFHDILPGSSIAQVHREAEESHARIQAGLESIRDQAIRLLTLGSQVVVNSAPFPRREVVVVPGDQVDQDASQVLSEGMAAVLVEAPGSGMSSLEPSSTDDVVHATGRALRNGQLVVRLDDDGLIESIEDLEADRELLPPDARCNLLQVHPDYPSAWDAWNLDRHYQNRHQNLTDVDSLEVIEYGPLAAAIKVVRSFGESTVSQTIRLRAESSMVETVTEVDWRARDSVLKLAFPLDVHTDKARSEIQFGYVERPTHTNTSWDAARFEAYTHRWVHISDEGYGVGLVNNASYGYDARAVHRSEGGRSTTVRITLLRASRFPDPTADLGPHRFVVGLLPGADIKATSDQGYALNLPLHVHGEPRRRLDLPEPLIEVDSRNVIVEAVKLAEDRSGDLIVRLYERLGGRGIARATINAPIAQAHLCDLLERPGEEVETDGQQLKLGLRPFQIVTVRISVDQ